MKFIQWLIVSSADPGKTSLMVKGILTGIVPILVAVAGVVHITIPGNDVLTASIDGVALAIQYGLGGVAAAIAAYGAIRKVWTTFNGTNAVIIAQKHEDGSFEG